LRVETPVFLTLPPSASLSSPIHFSTHTPNLPNESRKLCQTLDELSSSQISDLPLLLSLNFEFGTFGSSALRVPTLCSHSLLLSFHPPPRNRTTLKDASPSMSFTAAAPSSFPFPFPPPPPGDSDAPFAPDSGTLPSMSFDISPSVFRRFAVAWLAIVVFDTVSLLVSLLITQPSET